MKRMAQKAGASHSVFMVRRRSRKEAEKRLDGYKSPPADLTAEQLRAIMEADTSEACGAVGGASRD
jgi:hypothetical protein